VNAAKDNGIAIRFFRVVSETEGVTHVIGDTLDGVNLVIMRKDDGIAFFFKRNDFFLYGREWCLLANAWWKNKWFVIERSGWHIQ
jgi:hypothetical protein